MTSDERAALLWRQMVEASNAKQTHDEMRSLLAYAIRQSAICAAERMRDRCAAEASEHGPGPLPGEIARAIRNLIPTEK